MNTRFDFSVPFGIRPVSGPGQRIAKINVRDTQTGLLFRDFDLLLGR